MLVLVKLGSRPGEARELLANELKGKYKKEEVEREKKAVLAVIRLLLER